MTFMCVLSSPRPVSPYDSLIQLEEEEEKEDKFDLNISVTNPEKVGKSFLFNESWLTSKELHYYHWEVEC